MDKDSSALGLKNIYKYIVILISLEVVIGIIGYYLISYHQYYNRSVILSLVLSIFTIPLILFLFRIIKSKQSLSLKIDITQELKQRINSNLKEKKMLEEYLIQAEKLRSTEKVLNQIADDLIDILSVISRNISSKLSKNSDGNFNSSDLMRIENDILHATSLSKEIILNDGRDVNTSKLIRLNDEILEVLKYTEQTLPELIKVDLHLEDDLPPIYANSNRIKEMIENLITNAIDAMENGGILTITTRTIKVDHDFYNYNLMLKSGEYIQMSVADTGIGMTKEVIQHIYEPFFTTKSNKDKNPGLGLSIVSNIVKKYRGSITCFSVPKIGTTFQIYLPTLLYTNSDLKGRFYNDNFFELKKDNDFYYIKPTILVVDYDNKVQTMIKEFLENKGYAVIIAEDGLQALELFRENKYSIDLVIIDYQIPVLDGYECMVELLKINPALRIILSVESLKEVGVEEAIALSDEYLQKPYAMKDLYSCIEKVLMV